MTDLIQPLAVSLSVSISATILCALVGIPLGFNLSIHEFKGKKLFITVINTLLAMPTVVVGLLVYMALSQRSPLGGAGLLYTIPAMIIGQFILALPLMTALTHSAVSALDPAARETAITLGAAPLRVKLTLAMEARFGLMAAVAACFGRLIAEVGLSMIVGGNIAGYTRTMTTAIAMETSKGRFDTALILGGMLMGMALAVNAILQILQGKDR